MKRVAVVGAGWAGLAAAVRAREAGHAVTLFEMAAQAGGRARRVNHQGFALDNGQHILIGAYRETLALMRTVGVDPEAVLDRRPLAMCDPRGRGLVLPPGSPALAFVRGVLGMSHWRLHVRLALLASAVRWSLGGFTAPEAQTVAELTHRLPERARQEIVEPLCVAALNTPAGAASAVVFLRVIRDALFSGPGAADLLLPRVSLGEVLPEPALRWLAANGAELCRGRRVERLDRDDVAWGIDGERFDAVVLACGAAEAARLAAPHAPVWAEAASAIGYEPIVTVYLRSAGTRWPRPMVALQAMHDAPAQFAFDLGALDVHGERAGVFAFVVSGARRWVERGLDATAAAVLAQAHRELGREGWATPPTLLRALAERRATFLCTPGLRRPTTAIAPGLAAAGDHVQGPYPATLEGAVRSAGRALKMLGLSPGPAPG